MDDLISRQAAIDAIKQHIDQFDAIDVNFLDGLKTAINLVKELPSAQPEIIRCKDCKWSAEPYDTDGNVPYWVCKNWDGGTDADGYCYEAERWE